MLGRRLSIATLIPLVRTSAAAEDPLSRPAAALRGSVVQGSRALSEAALQESVLGSHYGAWGLDFNGMDRSLRPGDDFYDYINGEWLRETEIPADKSSWSAFGAIAEQTTGQVHAILEKAQQEGNMIGRFYEAYMDESTVEELGLSPLVPELQKITMIQTKSEFAAHLGGTQFGFGSSLFGLYVGADPDNSTINVAHLGQGGLGLPNRDYYMKETFAKTKAAYADYIVTMLNMSAWPEPEAAGASVMAFEEKIAAASWPKAALRDPTKTNNRMKVKDLASKVPGFDWSSFMKTAGGIPGDTQLVVSAYNGPTSDFGVTGIARFVEDAELSTLKAWSAFHMVSSAAGYLSSKFLEAHFDFAGKTLRGQDEMAPRWKRGVSVANAALGDAIGQQYVASYFPQSSKDKMDELTGLLKQAFARRLKNLTWMSEVTKGKALAKLDSFTFEVGYPKKWRNYAGLLVNKSDLFGNIKRKASFSWEYDLSQLAQPVDRELWDMPPQTVNAFFDPTQNKCVFLAAILQPPFFDPSADMSVNFGGIGAVIGHEMTHGFDDSGRKYDAHGVLNDWWTQADAEEFDKRARTYGQQFYNFTEGMPEGMHINPALTMGENIADLGGITISLDAYQMWLRRHSYKPQPPMLEDDGDSFEGHRRFFAAWAQVWRAKFRTAALKSRLTSDPHSPGMARGAIPPTNVDAWYDAFHVTSDQANFLDPAQRVQIW